MPPLDAPETARPIAPGTPGVLGVPGRHDRPRTPHMIAGMVLAFAGFLHLAMAPDGIAGHAGATFIGAALVLTGLAATFVDDEWIAAAAGWTGLVAAGTWVLAVTTRSVLWSHWLYAGRPGFAGVLLAAAEAAASWTALGGGPAHATRHSA